MWQHYIDSEWDILALEMMETFSIPTKASPLRDKYIRNHHLQPNPS